MRISLCPRVRKLRCRDRFSTKLSKREQQKQVVRTGRVCQGPRVGPTNAPRRAVPRGRSRKALPSEPGSACVRGHNRAAQPERLRGHTFILARPGGRTSEMQARAGLVPAELLSWACGRVPSLRPLPPGRPSACVSKDLISEAHPKCVPGMWRSTSQCRETQFSPAETMPIFHKIEAEQTVPNSWDEVGATQNEQLVDPVQQRHPPRRCGNRPRPHQPRHGRERQSKLA